MHPQTLSFVGNSNIENLEVDDFEPSQKTASHPGRCHAGSAKVELSLSVKQATKESSAQPNCLSCWLSILCLAPFVPVLNFNMFSFGI